MKTYIALLRGINVGGNKKIAMKDLQALVAGLGHAGVSTYIQSGNVLLRSAGAPEDVGRGIEEAIARELGLEVKVLIRSQDELAQVIEANPFLPGADPAHLHVTFLAGAPEPAALETLAVPKNPSEEYRIIGREVYLHFPEGYGRSKLSNMLWERKLRVAATTRNWNTVMTLLRLAGGAPGETDG
jgi:uncharacterized protein (DUF1697 family)